jgi:hypothetical protein
VADVASLPAVGNTVNDAYIVSADGNLWIWNGTAWFDAGQIVGPQGPAGADGATGAPGATGPTGAQGEVGATGAPGATGPTGAQGEVGPTGPQGVQGLQGVQGETGPAGTTDYTQLINTPTSITAFGITDGTFGQVLTTDGVGGFSFTTVGGGTTLPTDAVGVLKNDGFGTLTWTALDVGELTDIGGLLTQTQSDWNEVNTVSPAYIQNKPLIVTSYNELQDLPTLFDGNYLNLTDAPNLSLVATSGSYNDLIDVPFLAPIATSGSYADLNDAPFLAAVATTGNYIDLVGTPTIITDYTQLTNTPNLSTVATSGSYYDLIDTPNLSMVATTGDYNDLIGAPISITAFGITDGTSGQVLTTNGAGSFTFANSSVDANDLTGTTLASGVTASSLTSVGTLTELTVSGNVTAQANITVTGTDSNVIRRAFGLVESDTYVTLDDLKARVTSSTNQLSLMLTSGSWQGTGWTETFQGGGTPSVNSWINLPLSSGFDNASGSMPSQGNGCRCVISDQTPSAKVYQITVVRSGTSGAQWNISIERLV